MTVLMETHYMDINKVIEVTLNRASTHTPITWDIPTASTNIGTKAQHR